MARAAVAEVRLQPKNNNSRNAVQIDYSVLKEAAGVLRAVNHKLRQSIVKLLEEHGRLTVTEIYVRLKLEQSVASQHLAILRKARIVNTERDGKFIYYSLNNERIEDLSGLVEEIVGQ